jgi:hypothetical protein
MALSIEDVTRVMGMKDREIIDWYEVEDGTLVVTKEGAQTLIEPGGSIVAIGRDERRPIPTKGGRAASSAKK